VKSTILLDADLCLKFEKNLLYYKNILTKFNSNFKKAFTLAEVLIALVIVGVVAALTIPVAVAKYHKQETVSRLKKVYSALMTAYNSSTFENGPIETWTFGNSANISNSISKYILPYIQFTKNCGTNNSQCTSVDRVNLKGEYNS